MLPFYYGWLPDSKTAFVCLLAQIYPEVVTFESYNGELNGKWTFRKKISNKALFNGFFANLTPLYNSNVAKVSIVKCSQNWIFVDRNHFFGLPYNFKITLKTAIFQKNWVCQKWHFRPRKSNSETTLQ